jgi:hypothetical protein
MAVSLPRVPLCGGYGQSRTRLLHVGECPHLRSDCLFRRQALHAARTVKTVHTLAALENESGVRGLSDRAAVTQDYDVVADHSRGAGALVDRANAILKAKGRLGTDRTTGGQPHVADQYVGTHLSHRARLSWIEYIRRREQIQRARPRDHVYLLSVAHAGLFKIAPEIAVNEADSGKILDAGEAQAAQTV